MFFWNIPPGGQVAPWAPLKYATAHNATALLKKVTVRHDQIEV